MINRRILNFFFEFFFKVKELTRVEVISVAFIILNLAIKSIYIRQRHIRLKQIDLNVKQIKIQKNCL